MPGEIRRGSEAIQEAIDANANREGGNFRPFLPAIFWKEDKEARYLLILNPMEDIPQFNTVGFIPVEGSKFPEMVIAKTDVFFEEKTDQFEETWDATVGVRNFMIALELEPVLENVKGRDKPRGFEVATREFNRKVIDDDGNTTDETEEVTTPVVGVITQSPYNFSNVVKSFDATEAPIHETAIKITRIGTDQNTAYTVSGYEDMDIDLGNLVEYLDGISYIDDIDELTEEITDMDMDEMEIAHHLGSILLEKRITELLDEERYLELFEGVTESMDKFGNKKKSKGAGKKKTSERKARPSQRRRAEKEEPESTDDDAPEDTPEPKEKPKKSPAKKAAAKATTKESPAKAKLAEMREKAEAKRRAKAAEAE